MLKVELNIIQGRIQDFKLGGGAHLKKLRRAEGGANIFGVFRVKNHDFTQKNHIFSNCGGRRENFWGISCGKSRFYAKQILFFPILGGARAGCAPLWIRPCHKPIRLYRFHCFVIQSVLITFYLSDHSFLIFKRYPTLHFIFLLPLTC